MPINGKLPSSIRVYVIAENRLLRQALVRLFRKRSEIDIVGDSCCSNASIEDIISDKFDLLLLDCFNTKQVSGDWFCDLRAAAPEIKIVLFGMDEDPDVFLRAVRQGI